MGEISVLAGPLAAANPSETGRESEGPVLRRGQFPSKCPAFDMVADFMTKDTPKVTHERHVNRTMGDQSNALPMAPIQHVA